MSPYPSISPTIHSCLAFHYFEHSFHSYFPYLSLYPGDNRSLRQMANDKTDDTSFSIILKTWKNNNRAYADSIYKKI